MKIKGLYILTIVLFLFSPVIVIGQSPDFETKEWPSATDKPLIFYISGDGGFNSFSSDLCNSLNRAGYYVIALNAKKYFWDKKTPELTAAAIENFIIKKTASRQNKQVTAIGYSFGADVLPFVLNRFSNNLIPIISQAIMLASSGSTDFEIHWTDMFGGNSKRNMDVVAEINKISYCRLIHISGDKDELEEKRITLKNYIHKTLPGGHHFDGNIDELTKVILSDMH